MPEGNSIWPEPICRQVAGARGTGKSTYVMAKLRWENVRRRIIIDPLAGDDYAPGLVVERRAFDHREVMDYLKDVKPNDEFSISIVPPGPEHETVDWVCREILGSENRGNGVVNDCTLVVDEAHDSCKHLVCPDSVKKLAKRGRHWRVGLWLSSQRLKDVDPDLRAELNNYESVYFRLMEGVDLQVISQRNKEWVSVVRELPNFHYMKVAPQESLQPIMGMVNLDSQHLPIANDFGLDPTVYDDLDG